ncbi:MAG: HisS family protein [Nanoarchaeota archaeon]|nr:HisS family protein [Nanoarchaeota archaeon]
MKTETVKGFQDITGKDAIKLSEIKKKIVDNFEVYGFEPVETPVVEYEEFVKGNNTEDEAVSDIFKLSDKGGRKLALRYEFTFQLKRLMKNQKLPYKRYQIGPVFRDEPISANRFRQFTQCDIDVIGSAIENEAEILACVSRTFKKLGINFEINFNNRKLLNEILEKENIEEIDREKVIRELDKLDKLSEGEVENNLRGFGAQGLLKIFKKPEKYFEKYSGFKELIELKKSCKEYGVKINFQPSLARGLSYYNGSVFEIKTKKYKESLGGGGSYMFHNVQCSGISFSIERLLPLVKIGSFELVKCLVISIGKDKEAVKLSEKLRDEGISCSVFFGKPSKALEYSNSKEIKKVIFVGDDEVKKGKVTLKNMETGKEEKVAFKSVVKFLLKNK